MVKTKLSQAAQAGFDAAMAGKDGINITPEIAAEIAEFLTKKRERDGRLPRAERFIRDAAVAIRDYSYNAHMELCDTGRFLEEIPERPEDMLTSDARELLALSELIWRPEKITDPDVAREVSEYLHGKVDPLPDLAERELLEKIDEYLKQQ